MQEFSYTNYNVRYVLNHNDCTLRFEDKHTGKIYEGTISDQDFLQYYSMGGLEFISGVITGAFTQKHESLTVSCTLVHANLCLCFQYRVPFVSKPIEINLQLPQKQEEPATVDLFRKLQQMETQIQQLLEEKNNSPNRIVQSLQIQVDRLSAVLAQAVNAFTEEDAVADYAVVSFRPCYDISILERASMGEYSKIENWSEWLNCKGKVINLSKKGFRMHDITFTSGKSHGFDQTTFAFTFVKTNGKKENEIQDFMYIMGGTNDLDYKKRIIEHIENKWKLIGGSYQTEFGTYSKYTQFLVKYDS